MAHKPAQRWMPVRDPRLNEAILIKRWGFNPSGTRLAPQTNVEDPTTPAGAASRETIAFRAIAFLD